MQIMSYVVSLATIPCVIGVVRPVWLPFGPNIVLAGNQHWWAVISKCIESENYRSGLHKSAGDVWCLYTSRHLNAVTSAGDVLYHKAFTTQL